MRLSEIQNKDVINLNTGMKIGNIIDIKINSESGKIESLILERKKFSSIFNSNDEIEIYMNNGWQVNLKLSLSELSMINDIRLVGVPAM